MKPTSDAGSTQRMRLEGTALRVLSDERLARLAAKGDRVAFAVIFDRYHQRLFGYCASILHDRDDAADAVQTTMLRAMRALEGEEREIAVRPWLYRIAHNEAIELLRRPRAEPASDAEVVTVSDVEADAAVRAHLRAVLDDIRELPDRQRSALVMRELAGLSYTEIAAALQTTATGAKQAVYDARQALHQLAKGRDTDCELIRRKLSDGDRRTFRGRTVRAHLTACADCRSWEAELAARETSWAAFAPTMPAAAAAGALHGAVGGGAAAAGSFAGVSATAAGPALATMAVAVVLGAGAVGVHELRQDDGETGTPGVGARAEPAPQLPSGTRAASDGGRERPRRGRTVARDKQGDAETRAERARARERERRAAARRRRSARDGSKGGERHPGAGSTELAGTPTGSGGASSGGRGSGVKSWLGGGRGRGDGQDGDARGPIGTTVDDTRQAVQGTVDQVQQALPVPAPELPPIAGSPRGGRPDR